MLVSREVSRFVFASARSMVVDGKMSVSMLSRVAAPSRTHVRDGLDCAGCCFPACLCLDSDSLCWVTVFLFPSPLPSHPPMSDVEMLFFSWSRDYFFLVYPSRGYKAVSVGRQRHWVSLVVEAHILLSYDVGWVHGFRDSF